jgi:hypothetical protein
MCIVHTACMLGTMCSMCTMHILHILRHATILPRGNDIAGRDRPHMGDSLLFVQLVGEQVKFGFYRRTGGKLTPVECVSI